MSRNFSPLALNILGNLLGEEQVSFEKLYQNLGKKTKYKEFYNTAYRLSGLGLIEKKEVGGKPGASITAEGKKLINRLKPSRDGVWKLVIFDIPEKQKYVRTVLRAKLKSLNFKKWQNSIWISPYELDQDIEQELNELAKKFFVRLIKTTQINRDEDLEKLFS